MSLLVLFASSLISALLLFAFDLEDSSASDDDLSASERAAGYTILVLVCLFTGGHFVFSRYVCR